MSMNILSKIVRLCCSHFNFHLLHALCTHVFYVFVFVPYALSGLSFMSIKICSVLFCMESD